MVNHRILAAAVAGSVGFVEFPIPPAYGLLPSFVASLACAVAAALLLPMERPYCDACPRPAARGVFHAGLGGALWALFAREVAAPRAAPQQAFLLGMNAACLTASAVFHDAAPTRRGHDRRLCVDVSLAGLPMVAMLRVFTWAPADRWGSAAFLACLALASYREIILKRTSLEALRSGLIVVYFAYVEYAAMSSSPPAWAATQFVAFASTFASLVFVDDRRKVKRAPIALPHHRDAWTAHEDAHALLGVAQALVYHRSVVLHGFPG